MYGNKMFNNSDIKCPIFNNLKITHDAQKRCVLIRTERIKRASSLNIYHLSVHDNIQY